MTLIDNLQTPPSISGKDVNESQTMFHVEAAFLQTIENVLTGIEKIQLQVAPACNPTIEIPKRIFESREGIAQSTENNDINQSDTDISEKLDLWRKSLVVRDQKISAFDLRTFCSNVHPQFENDIYYALAGFYRSLSPIASVLSKFDYVITHYFSCEMNNNRRALRMNADELVTTLRQLNLEWSGEKTKAAPMKSQIRESIFALSKLSVQAKTHPTLKSWLDSEFFNHSRKIKRGLGETLFVPEVTATVILYNLTVGNQFAALCEADSAIPSDASGTTFAHEKDASDAITDQLNSSFQTLLYSHLEDDFAESMAHERLTNLFNLISDEGINEKINKENLVDQLSLPDKALPEDSSHHIEVTTPVSEILEKANLLKTSEMSLLSETETILTQSIYEKDLQENTNSADLTINQEPQSINVNKIDGQIADKTNQNTSQTFMEMGSVLKELSQLIPDREIIKNYLQKSATAEIRDLRFDEFLNVEKETDDKNLRRVLRLIISAEEIIRLVSSGEGDLSPAFSDELHLLNEEIQLVSNRLRRLMKGWVNAAENVDKIQKDYFETLLYATNTLLETQLRLNSTTVRRQNKEDQFSDLPSSKLNTSKSKKLNAQDTTSKLPAIFLNPQQSKWLLAAAALVILLSGTWLIFNWTSAQKTSASPNVQTIDPTSLQGGAALIAAKINKNTLFGFVGEKWTSQTLEQKKANLKLLLDEGGKHGFNKVLLINQNGELVGDASENSTTVL
ncbi:MAG: hypothetical protein ABI954_00775 [Pyrinomonadaceae bacterium]